MSNCFTDWIGEYEWWVWSWLWIQPHSRTLCYFLQQLFQEIRPDYLITARSEMDFVPSNSEEEEERLDHQKCLEALEQCCSHWSRIAVHLEIMNPWVVAVFEAWIVRVDTVAWAKHFLRTSKHWLWSAAECRFNCIGVVNVIWAENRSDRWCAHGSSVFINRARASQLELLTVLGGKPDYYAS